MTSSLYVPVRDIKMGVPSRSVGAIIPIEGTVYPGAPNPPSFITDDGNGYYCGFASAMVGGAANAKDGMWANPSYPFGQTQNVCGVGYPAVTTPMWPSVQQARTNCGILSAATAKKFYLINGSYDGLVLTYSAWSQGVMGFMQWFILDVLPIGAPFHYLLPYIWRLYLYGDPFRCPNIAHGNDLAGISLPPKLDGQITGGIAGPQDYTADVANLEAPDGTQLVLSFVNENDLYADAPVGPDPWSSEPSVGRVEYLFFKIIMQPNFSDIIELATLLGKPIGDVEALINTGEFFGAGNNAGHYQYFPGMDAAINDLLTLGDSLPMMSGY